MAAILNSAIMDSGNLHKQNFTHSFWLILMMAAILNYGMLHSDTAILDSDNLLSSLRFTQKHSPSTLTLTQTNSIWLTRWWQPSWLLPSWIQPFCSKLWLQLIQSDSKSFILTQLDDGSHIEFCHIAFSHLHKKNVTLAFSLKFTQWQPSWILLSWIQPFCTKKIFTHSFWLNLMMAAILNSVILDSAILHKTLTPTNSILLKLIHSHLTWWWQPSCILPSWIQTSWIQPFC